MEILHYIGVDISKNTLDFAVYKGKGFVLHRQVPNDTKSIRRFINWLSKEVEGFSLGLSVFCMEHTGIYNNLLLMCLHKKKGNIWLESALHIKKSMGVLRGKDDKVDAKRIAQYAYRHKDGMKLWEPRREVVTKLKHLTVIRDRLIKAKNKLSVPLSEQGDFIDKVQARMLKRTCALTLKAIDRDIKGVDEQIGELVHSDERLARLFSIVTSIPSVGPQTAVQLIVKTNEFKNITEAKKLACYCGVAPFAHSSGLFKGRSRVSPVADKKLKTTLHLAAIVAIRHNDDLRQYYERKVAEGKNKLLVINAVRNKLIHRVYACINENRPYQKKYSPRLV